MSTHNVFVKGDVLLMSTASNEYQQHMLSWINEKNIFT